MRMPRPLLLPFCLLSLPPSAHSFLPPISLPRCNPLHNTMSASTPADAAAAAAAPACGLGANRGKCAPCESLDKSHLLTADAVEQELATSLKMWKMKPLGTDGGDGDGGSQTHVLSRSFTARNFQCALNFLNAVGVLAERENHHPDLHLTGYRNVEIVLYTHSLGGITANDLALAREMDAIPVEYSPKWLKSHPEASSSNGE